MLKIVISLVLGFLLLLTAPGVSFAGLFEQNANLPGLVVCEVKSFGENALRQEFFYTFEDLLREKLQASTKIKLEPKWSGNILLPSGETATLDEAFNLIHMDAIVNSSFFAQEEANGELRTYLQNYYQNKLRKVPYLGGKKKSSVYTLGSSLRNLVQEISTDKGVKYLLFCNLKNAEVDIKHHYDSSGFQSLKGTKVKVDIDYYLINANNFKVYEAYSTNDKTAQIFDFIILKFGKQFTTQQLLQGVLEVQAEKIAKDLTEKGLPQLN